MHLSLTNSSWRAGWVTAGCIAQEGGRLSMKLHKQKLCREKQEQAWALEATTAPSPLPRRHWAILHLLHHLCPLLGPLGPTGKGQVCSWGTGPALVKRYCRGQVKTDSFLSRRTRSFTCSPVIPSFFIGVVINQLLWGAGTSPILHPCSHPVPTIKPLPFLISGFHACWHTLENLRRAQGMG